MSFVEAGGYFAQQRNNAAAAAKYHRDRMEALKLPEHNCLNVEELTRLYNQNIERAYDYGIESITGRPAVVPAPDVPMPHACMKCRKPKPNDKYTMCAECDWAFTLAIFN